MPPKSSQKGAKTPNKKRSSPRSKKATTPTKPDPLPAITEENADAREEALAMEEKIAPLDAIEDKATKIEGEAAVVPMEEERAPTDAVEEETKLEVEETGVEKILEETTMEKIEGENVVEEEPVEEEPVEEEPIEGVDDKGNEGEENERAEEVKEEEEGVKEPEDKGVKQLVEEGTGEGEVEGISGDDEEDEEDDPSMFMQAPMTDTKRQKEFELHIAGLDKGAVDEDLIKVFGVFGEIQSVRIVRHPLTQKSKGFAFIRYTSFEHAKKALAELKDGTEIKGKKIRISVSQDNDTLYLGNICRTWTRDRVLETLKGYGIEKIEDMLLPDDPESEGKIRGFAFVEFKNHSDAMSAFQRLRKPDAVFGCNVSAKVAFAEAPLHPCEENLLKVKTVYLEGIPESWDKGKVEELCKQYGEIEKTQLSKNFTSSKRKYFGFVEFSSRDGAIACVGGINNTHLGENVTFQIKASFAKPMYRSRLAKQTRGGYKVQKNGEATEVTTEEAGKSKKKNAKSKEVNDKKETPPNLMRSNGTITSKTQDKSLKEKKGSQIPQSAKGKKRDRKGTFTAVNQHPSKKPRQNHTYEKGLGGSSAGFSNPRSSYSSHRYLLGQTTPAHTATSYTAHPHSGAFGSQHRCTDLEPHAGFLPAANQVQNPRAYEGGRAGAYGPRSSFGYPGASMAQSSYPVQSSHLVRSAYPVQSSHAVQSSRPVPSSYPGYSNYAANQAGYVYPGSGAYVYPRSYY